MLTTIEDVAVEVLLKVLSEDAAKALAAEIAQTATPKVHAEAARIAADALSLPKPPTKAAKAAAKSRPAKAKAKRSKAPAATKKKKSSARAKSLNLGSVPANGQAKPESSPSRHATLL